MNELKILGEGLSKERIDKNIGKKVKPFDKILERINIKNINTINIHKRYRYALEEYYKQIEKKRPYYVVIYADIYTVRGQKKEISESGPFVVKTRVPEDKWDQEHFIDLILFQFMEDGYEKDFGIQWKPIEIIKIGGKNSKLYTEQFKNNEFQVKGKEPNTKEQANIIYSPVFQISANYYYLGDHNVWDRKLGHCIEDYLFTKYSSHIAEINRETLKAEFENARIINQRDYNCAHDVLQWCNARDISCHVLDPFWRPVAQVISVNRNYPSLYFIINNEHLYPIENPQLQKAVLNNTISDYRNFNIDWKNTTITYQGSQEVDKWKPSESAITIIGELHYQGHTVNTLMPLIHKIFREEQLLPEITRCWNGHCITGFNYKEKIIILDQSYEYITSTLEKIKNSSEIDELTKQLCYYQNQDEADIFDLIMESRSFQDFPQGSELNNLTKEYYKRYEPFPWVEYLVHPDDVDRNNCKEYDISRCYTSFFKERKEPLTLHNIFNDPQPVSGNLKEKIELGYYLVENVILGNQYHQLNIGTSWWDHEQIKYLLKNKLIIVNQIKYHLPAYSYVNADLIRRVIEIIYRLDLPDQFVKKAVNLTVGWFGKTKNNKKSMFLTTSLEASECLLDDDTTVSKFEELYAVQTKKLQERPINHRLWWGSVVNHGNLKLHEMINELVGPKSEVIAIKTDAIILTNALSNSYTKKPEKTELETVGHIYVNHNPQLTMRIIKRPILPYEPLKSIEWNSQTNEDRLQSFITGMAGCGKSYTVLHSFIPVLESNNLTYVTTAYSYKCIDELLQKGYKQANTFLINLLLGHTQSDNLTKIAERYKYIIVDEYLCIQKDHMALLYRLFKLGVKFIFMGENSQLEQIDKNPIEYSELSFFREMCAYQKYELPYNPNGRYDKQLYDTLVHLKKTGELKIPTVSHMPAFTNSITLAYLNNSINNLHNQVQLHTKGPYYELANIKIPPLSPVICVTNNLLAYNIWNSKRFTLKTWNDKQVQLCSAVLTVKEFNDNFKPAYAMTVHKAQGSTIKEPLIVWIDKLWEKRMLYTALSRATCYSNITVVNPHGQQYFIDAIHKNEPYEYAKVKKEFLGFIYSFLDQDKLYIGSTNDLSRKSSEHGRVLSLVREVYYDDVKELHEIEHQYITRFALAGFKLLDKNGLVESSRLSLIGLDKHIFERPKEKAIKKPGSIRITDKQVIYEYYDGSEKKKKSWNYGGKRNKENAYKEALEMQESVYQSKVAITKGNGMTND